MFSTKHWLHVISCLTIIAYFIQRSTNSGGSDVDEQNYSLLKKIVLYILSLMPILLLPMHMSMLLGLLLYECFPSKVELKANMDQLPLLCFRVVTKGSFPKLILKNLKQNQQTCEKAGLKNFVIEIVTEKRIDGLVESKIAKQTIVPTEYSTKKKTLFKARNLQYCLEDNVNVLKDDDWIIHLEEDSIVTEDAIRGIANFVAEDKHCFGCGVIDGNVDGEVSILSEIVEVMPLFDYGSIRFDMKCFHTPHFVIRTTFLVAKVGAEKDVSFDVESGPSLLEDIALGLMIKLKGYSVGGVEGNFLEQAATSLPDYLNSRARVVKGFFYVVFSSSYYNIRNSKISSLYYLYFFFCPLILPSIVCGILYPIHQCKSMLILKGLNIGFVIYGQIFMVLKNHHKSVFEYAYRILVSVFLGPVLGIIVWQGIYLKAFFTKSKLEFYNSTKNQ